MTAKSTKSTASGTPVGRGSSPYATGGGGVTLERRVAVLYLSRLLSGATAFELRGRRVKRVSFQQAPAHHIDDLVVLAERDQNLDPLELCVAVRRAPSFTSSDSDTEKLVGDLLLELASVAPADRRVAVCVAGQQLAAQQVGLLAALASRQATAQGFFALVRTPNRYQQAVVERLRHVVNLVSSNLSKIGKPGTVSAGETATWELLQRLDILMPRIEVPDESDWHDLLNNLEPWVQGGGLKSSEALRDRLESLAATYAPNAASVDLTMLRRDAYELLRQDDLPARRRPASHPRPPEIATASGSLTASNYVELVRELAPAELQGRDSELVELANFCRGDEQYVWWKGEPWAGKSALLTTFVLNPPRGTDVVSFFITARFASQSDSNAFTEAMVDQLACLTGRPSSTDSPGQRDLHRRALLRAAAERGAASGRRLILVVDGLDEDTGARSGSGIPSIASLLPKQPEPNLRVIVASRYNPTTPADVPLDHPLRRCRVRELAPSVYATHLAHRAMAELDGLLVDSSDAGKAVREIVGYTAASGGGLTLADFEELTGRPPYELTSILQSALGRTMATRRLIFQRGGSGFNETVVIAFAHESLRTMALERLGRTLDRYRDRIHQWAETYQQRRWPTDTPQYLFRAYYHSLTDVSDISRMVACATDVHRHRVLYGLTGGDDSALAEIAAAESALLEGDSQDLHSMTRLAIRRAALTGRNNNIFDDLPIAWARIGSLARGEALARSITASFRKAKALAGLVKPLLDAGQRQHAAMVAQEAEMLARSWPEDYMQGMALIAVVQAVGHLGELERAIQLGQLTVGRIPQLADDFVKALIAIGELEKAEEVGSTISEEPRRSRALAALICAVSLRGDLSHAQELISNIVEVSQRALALAALATAMARKGRSVEAERVLTDAMRLAAIDGPTTNADAAVAVATAMVNIGEHGWAEEMAQKIRDSTTQARVITAIATALARSGELAHAEVLVRSVDDDQRDGLLGYAIAVAEAGDHERAKQVLTEAEARARSSYDPNKVWELTDVVVTIAEFGHFEKAAEIAGLIPYPYERAWTSASLALAKVKDYPDQAIALSGQALQNAETLTNHSLRRGVTGVVAQVRAKAGDIVGAVNLVESDPDLSRSSGQFAELARAARDANDARRASSLCGRAEELLPRPAATLDDWMEFAYLARAVAHLGDLDRAERMAESIEDQMARNWALAFVLQEAIRLGDVDRAESMARRLSMAELYVPVLAESVEILAKAGFFERAVDLAQSISEDFERVRSWSKLAQVATERGNLHDAARFLQDAEQLASTIESDHVRTRSLAFVALATEPGHARRLMMHVLKSGTLRVNLAALMSIDDSVLPVVVDEYRHTLRLWQHDVWP